MQATAPPLPTEPVTVAVCYLVRFGEQTAAVTRFVESYQAHPAGVEHDLVILFKGFASEEAKQPWRHLFASLTYRELDFADVGFTDVPFHSTAQLLDYQYFLFLNTWNYVLTPNWLGLMVAQIVQPGMGAVGATASCESILTTAFPPHSRHYPWPIGRKSWRRQVIRWYYPPFPNFHLRSTGFLISKQVMNRIKLPRLRTKEDALRFESGKDSFTRQIERMGLRAAVVGRDGLAYDGKDAWKSHTFRQGNQANLLIGDNRTVSFAAADPHEQNVLNYVTWGDEKSRPPS